MTNQSPEQLPEPAACGKSLGDIIVMAAWKRCVGVCIGTCYSDVRQEPTGPCNRQFISRERYDEHIAPQLQELAALQERAAKAEEQLAAIRLATIEEVAKHLDYLGEHEIPCREDQEVYYCAAEDVRAMNPAYIREEE